jgi:hypothetical protein
MGTKVTGSLGWWGYLCGGSLEEEGMEEQIAKAEW